jgi:hypothetical protein
MNLNALIAGFLMSAPPIYIPPPPQAYYQQQRQHVRSEKEWRAAIMAEARKFCSTYPKDDACNNPQPGAPQ